MTARIIARTGWRVIPRSIGSPLARSGSPASAPTDRAIAAHGDDAFHPHAAGVHEHGLTVRAVELLGQPNAGCRMAFAPVTGLLPDSLT